jgi:hypothetical protein
LAESVFEVVRELFFLPFPQKTGLDPSDSDRSTAMSDAAPAPAGDSPPPQHPENGGSISSMVASSASSAAAAAADFTRRGEAFGADMATSARAAVDTAAAHAHSSALAASDAANSAVSSALAAFPALTHAAKVPPLPSLRSHRNSLELQLTVALFMSL